MYISIAVAIALSTGIHIFFSRRLEGIQQRTRKLEAELNVLKHEELHKKFQQIKLHTKSSTVADDVAYTWDVYAQKRLRKGWK
jgi:hypothetical protein